MRRIILLLSILILFTSCNISNKKDTTNCTVNTEISTNEIKNYYDEVFYFDKLNAKDVYVKYPVFTCKPWSENKEIESQITGVLVRRVVGDFDIYSNGYFHSNYKILSLTGEGIEIQLKYEGKIFLDDEETNSGSVSFKIRYENNDFKLVGAESRAIDNYVSYDENLELKYLDEDDISGDTSGFKRFIKYPVFEAESYCTYASVEKCLNELGIDLYNLKETDEFNVDYKVIENKIEGKKVEYIIRYKTDNMSETKTVSKICTYGEIND